MGIVFRQSVKAIIVTFSGAVLGAIITYVYAFALSKQEIGFFTNFIFSGVVLQLLVQLGTGSLIITYVQKYDVDDVRRKALISFGMLVTVCSCIIFSVAYLLLKDFVITHYQLRDSEYLNRYYVWMLGLTVLWSFMTLLELYLLSQSKLAIAMFMREVLLRLCNLILIALVYFGVLSFNDFMIGSVLVYIVPVCIMLFIAFKTKGFGFTTRFNVFSLDEYKEFFHFSWYHLLLGASLNFLGYIDTLMLAPLDKTGMESLAVYRWAVMIIGIMIIPYRAMTNASYPILNQAYIDKNMDKLSDLFHRSGINILIMAVGMFVLIGCNLDNVIRILPEGYDAIKPVVFILMAGKLVDMATGLNNELISISKYYKFNFRLSVLLVIMAVIFNRILIPQYSVYGAAAGITTAVILFNIIKMIFLWKKMQLQPFTSKSYLVVLAGAGCFAIGYYLPFIINPVVDTIIRSGIIFIMYVLLLILIKPSPDLTTYLQSMKANKRLY